MALNGLIAHAVTGTIMDSSELVNSNNPLMIVKNLTLTVRDICFPSHIKYTTKCVIFFATCGYALFSTDPFGKVACFSMLRSVIN